MENTEIKVILTELEKIQKQIESINKELWPHAPNNLTRSSSLKELFTALAKAQAEMKSAGLNSENPYFKSKYADLEEIVTASRPALAKNGLSVIQQILPNDDGQNILHTILAHNSGEWIESRMRILPSKPDVQSLASYITYIRRYSYAAIVGVVVGGEDDDAEKDVATSRDTFAKGVALNTKYNPKEETYESISSDQLNELEYELAEYPDIAEQVLSGLKLQNLSDMPKSKFLIATKRIREIKNMRNGK